MATTEQMVLEIIADNKDARKAINQITQDQTKLASQSKNTFGQLKLGWLAVAGAITGVVIGIKKVIDAANIQIKADVALGQSLKNTGKYTRESYTELKKYATELQKTTNIEDNRAQSIMSAALNMGISTRKVKEATAGAIGLSTQFESMGLTAEVALKGIANAYNGNFAQLQRYIPELQSASSETDKMAILQRAMADGMSTAEAQTQTFGGQLTAMNNALGDAKESIGMALMPILLPFVKIIAKLAAGFEAMPAPLKLIILGIIGVAAAVKIFGASLAFLNLNPIMLAITGLTVAVGAYFAIMSKASNALDENLKGHQDQVAGLKEVNQGLDSQIERMKKYAAEAKAAGKSTKEYDERITQLRISMESTNKTIAESEKKIKELSKTQKGALKDADIPGITIGEPGDPGKAFDLVSRTKEVDRQIKENKIFDEEEIYQMKLGYMNFWLMQVTEGSEAEIEITAQKNTLIYEHEKTLNDQKVSLAQGAAQAFIDSTGSAVSDFSIGMARMAIAGEQYKKSFGEVAKQILMDITAMIIKMLVFRALMTVFGAVPGLGFIGAAFGKLGGMAEGGVASGGPALVGERGPEVVMLPRGAQVIPNHALPDWLSSMNIPHYANGTTNNYKTSYSSPRETNINFPNAIIPDERSMIPFAKILRRSGEIIDATGEAY